jgi:nucleoside-diphosphate-sugar epimerase
MALTGPLKEGGTARRVVVAGATGYLWKFVTLEFKRRGYWVRALTRSAQKLEEAGPFTAPGIADAMAPAVGKTALRSYFETLA